MKRTLVTLITTAAIFVFIASITAAGFLMGRHVEEESQVVEIWCYDPAWVDAPNGEMAVRIARCQTPEGAAITVKWID
jgi:hypothetical protein